MHSLSSSLSQRAIMSVWENPHVTLRMYTLSRVLTSVGTVEDLGPVSPKPCM